MKISERFHEAARDGRTIWSFEYFPPRTAQGLQNLYDRIERMRHLGPDFIDITWGAGGKNSDLTLNLVQICQQTIGIETCMHLCCTEMPTEKVKEALRVAKQAGCQNILALRGDPPHGQSNWTPPPGGFSKAIDLVKYIRAEYGDYFDIAVAGFPQGHPETAPGEDAQAKEIQYLKEKVDAGANFIFTQMFYDVDIFVNWVKRVRAAGIEVPIVPGIMPIQSWQKFMTWVKRENIVVPQKFWDVLLPVQEDDERVRAIGTKLVADMCRDILAADIGIRGLHVYTLNLEKGARMLLDELGFEGRKEQTQPLPWRPSLTPARRQESIRPIFWANRQQSYLSRTDDWDEFPNGRWGDSRSPAYGDLDGYPVKIDIPAAEADEIWGQPQTFEDIKALFARFCLHDLRALPWSTQPPSKETSVIDQQLAKMNRLGYLTINSQPAVDGAPSTDPTHGWGPAGGYVYQKAYLEFFVAPQLLDELVKRIERDPRITYYAVNRQGDLRTNTHSEGPNAVTWGVFPGKEIIQPTIVEAVSFIAWKDEAFELGVQWASLYPEGSEPRKLIQQVMDTSYLVNIVANDFKDGMSIFEPFQLERADSLPPLPKSEPSVSPAAITGVAQVIKDSATAVKDTAQSVVAAVQEKVLGNGTNGTSDDQEGSLATPPAVNGAAKEKGSSYDVDAPTKADDAPKETGKVNTDGDTEGRLPTTPTVNGAAGKTKVSSKQDGESEIPELPAGMPHISESEIQAAVGSRVEDLLRPTTGPNPRKRLTPADLDTLFDDVPLFMRDNAKAAVSENETLEALKTLVFEGSGDEVALNFKNHAVENHQQGKLREALAQYTQGIEAGPEDPALMESLLLNRAACNLSLANYGSVLRDTSAVLKLNPIQPKAYFRAASALLSLSRWEDALKCIDHGKQLESEKEDSKQAMWQGLEQKAKKGLTVTAEKEERIRRVKLGKDALQQAIKARGILQVHTAAPPDNPNPVAFDEDSIPQVPLTPPEGVTWSPPPVAAPLVFPAFFLYPTAQTSDLITRFHEDSTFYDQLEAMFPLSSDGQAAHPGITWADWDKAHEFRSDNLSIYAITRNKKLLKIGRNHTLRQVAEKAASLSAPGQRDGLVMQDGLMSFIVLPTGAGEKEWLERFKADRDGSQ
ncbi:methylenetetrahydrofolate reductase (NAD(P)H) met13 [Naganishia albida]|nr:methylenetetrahydrofolate reductase (NAD(P)H) met13 [Naganishia albida]